MSSLNAPVAPWPPLPYAQWQETASALHLWTQIVGKYRLARTPWVNHSWHATLYVTPRGLTTGPIPDVRGTVTLAFDLRAHALSAETDQGAREAFALGPMSVADFFQRTKALLAKVGATPMLHGTPSEMPEPIPFAADTRERPYDAKAVERFHEALVRIDRVFAA